MRPPRLGLLLEILVKAGGELGSRAMPEVMMLHRIACLAWFWHCAEAEAGGGFLQGLLL